MADGAADWRKLNPMPAARAAGVCVVLRAETRPGADDRFEALLSDLAYTVRAEERGCLAYVATRQTGSADHFAVHARFASWRAFQRHALTRHLERAMPRLTALLAAPVTMEIFLEI
jgi:quinol monooxygenase YgiN